MNGWIRTNKNRYELKYNEKTYLTVIEGRRETEKKIKNNIIQGIEDYMFVENSFMYDSSMNINPPFLYREYIAIDLRKKTIKEYLEIIQLKYLEICKNKKEELMKNIDNKEYIKTLKDNWGYKWKELIKFINDNYDILLILSNETKKEKSEKTYKK